MNLKQLLIQSLFLGTSLLFCTSESEASTWCVRASQTTYTPTTPGFDPLLYGKSWDKAFPYLQDALTVAQTGDKILISQGWYHPDDDDDWPVSPGSTHTDNDRNHSFIMKDRVWIQGGWEGTGNFGNWDPEVYITNLSGDIDRNDDHEDPDLYQWQRERNSYHVVTGGHPLYEYTIDDGAILEGCVVRDGHVTGGGSFGAGLFVPGGADPNHPTIQDCVFTRNLTEDEGGAVFVEAAASENDTVTIFFNNCHFVDNESYSGGGLAGEHFTDLDVRNCEFNGNRAFSTGGAYLASQNKSFFTNCRFEGNLQTSDQSGSGGGAIYHKKGVTLEVRHSKFVGNESVGPGGVLYQDLDSNSNIEFVDVLFEGNKTEGYEADGGAIWSSVNTPPMQLVNCIFHLNQAIRNSKPRSRGGAVFFHEAASAVMMNCLLFENGADLGAGVYTKADVLAITNCTITKNDAFNVAGGVYCETAPNIANSILWANIDGNSSNVVDKQIFVGVLTPSVTYSCIDDGASGGSIPFNTGGNTSNIDSDPDFVDPDNDNYRLISSSPCVDAGSNPAVEMDDGDIDEDQDENEKTPLDLELRARFGNGGIDCNVDMGAFEFTDCDGDDIDDSDEIDQDPALDCNVNGMLDACELVPEPAHPPLLGQNPPPAPAMWDALAADGVWIVMGSKDYLNGQGTAWFFKKVSATAWGNLNSKSSPNHEAGDEFGASVTISGEWVAIGAPGEDDITNGENSGRVYVYKLNMSTNQWNLDATLERPVGEDNRFGRCVSMHGDVLAVSSEGDDSQSIDH